MNTLGINETCDGFETNDIAHEINAMFESNYTTEMPITSEYDTADYSTEKPWKRIYESKTDPIEFMKLCGLNFVALYKVKGSDEWHEEGYYTTKDEAKEGAFSQILSYIDIVTESKIEAL